MIELALYVGAGAFIGSVAGLVVGLLIGLSILKLIDVLEG